MTDDKTRPDPNDQSERAVPEQSSTQTQQGRADVPSLAAQPNQRAAPGRKPLFRS